MSTAPAIEFRNVSYRLPDGRALLEDVTLEVAAGTTVALLGKSGSGKTTLLRAVNRLHGISSGDVLVRGRSVYEQEPIALRRSIGYVIQESGLFPHFTVERNIGLVMEIEGRPRDEIRQRAHALLEMVGLNAGEFARRLPHALSGGQRQRVGLARALAAGQDILLMDEPFGALDPLTRAEMQDVLRRLTVEVQPSGARTTALLVTHDLDEALYLAERVVLVDGGGIAANLAAEDFLRSDVPAVQAYVRAVHRGTEMQAHAAQGHGMRPLNSSPGFLQQHWDEITTLTLEHLWLTGSAMLFATAIAVPLGILLTRKRALARPVLGVVNTLQTIPSLAMFGFLLPLPFVGERAARIAIVALVAYALLPIVRNTYTGISGVDATVMDVACAVGMTGWQRLRKVELPLAMPFILAGLRTATVTCVGIATIAAAVGAGGLGEFIFRGVASVDNRLVLAGAVPAALLALAADGLLGLLEWRLRVPGSGKP